MERVKVGLRNPKILGNFPCDKQIFTLSWTSNDHRHGPDVHPWDDLQRPGIVSPCTRATDRPTSNNRTESALDTTLYPSFVAGRRAAHRARRSAQTYRDKWSLYRPGRLYVPFCRCGLARSIQLPTVILRLTCDTLCTIDSHREETPRASL